MTKKNAVEKHGFNPNTVFEDILAGKLPAEFVYEDELVTAFMDIQPITDGHVLSYPEYKGGHTRRAETRVRRTDVSRCPEDCSRYEGIYPRL